MSGLTSAQQWTHDHLVRCTCGAWMVVTHQTLTRITETDTHPECPHATHHETEAVA